MGSEPRGPRPRSVAVVALAATVLAALGAWAVLESGLLEVPAAELEQRYRLPQSRFVEIDGVRVHYVDEGRGPPVLLVHASFMSLRTWDGVAAELAKQHRVVRFDRVGLGLTGPDPRGLYSRDRDQQIIDGLLDRLGLDRVALVGTSSGGGVAFHYAAARPDRVSHLVLINSGGLPRTASTDPNRAQGTALGRWIRARYQSEGWWREQLEQQFASTPVPDALVQQVYDLNRRAGQREIARATRGNFRTGDPEAVLGTVTAPALVAWGLDNVTLSHLEADVFRHWLLQAPTAIRKYEDAGHYVYLEKPAQVAGDIAAFLAGRLPLRPPVAPCTGGGAAPAADATRAASASQGGDGALLASTRNARTAGP